MSARSDVLLWAQRIAAKGKTASAHELLGLKPNATLEEAQDAFHKVARMAHPDLHRNGLSPEELAKVEAAYAIVAGAYHQFRTQNMRRPGDSQPVVVGGATPPAGVPTPPPSSAAPPRVTPSGPAPSGNAAQSMSGRALVYYRKAEIALRRGDLKSALLQIKMAIAADPGSAFLRTALAEVETELRKG